MDFHQLQRIGGFVSPELVVRTIDFTRPRLPEEGEGEPITESADIHIRKRTSRDFLDISRAEDAAKPFLALHRCVCNADGSPLFPSADDAERLAEWLFGPMVNAVNEVNRFSPKSGTARTSSGTTSPSHGAGASRNSKRASRKKSDRPG